MALGKQLVPFIFDQGVDTKTDPKLLGAKPFLLENAVIKKRGRISKRDGGRKLGSTILGTSTSVGDADALGTFNDELQVFANQSIYSYSESVDALVSKGSAISCEVTISDLVKNSYEQSQVDQAVVNNVALIVWEDSRGGLRYTVNDLATGTALVVDSELHATATRPRCMAFKDVLFVFYYDSGNLYARSISPLNPTTLGAQQTISSVVNTTNPNYDVTTQDEFMVVAYNVQGATQTRIHKLNINATVTATSNIAEASTGAVCLIRGASANTFVVFYTGTAVRAALVNLGITVTVGPSTVETVANVVQLTGYFLADGSGVRLFYQISAAQTYNHLVRTNTFTNGGSVGTAAVFLRSVGIVSRPWLEGDRGFIGLAHQSATQSTYFVARDDGLLVAKLAYGYARGHLSRTLPANVCECEPGVFTFPILTRNPIVSLGDRQFVTFSGVSRATLDFSNVRNFASAQLGDNLIIVGGIVQNYDGQSVVEQGFHLFPENVSAAESTGGSLTLLGTYLYRVCYEWTDNSGKIHRSAPSTGTTITLTGSNNRVTLTIPTLRLTAKQAPRTPITIVVYRTESLGTVLYRCSSPTTLTYNSTTADTVTIVDDLSDATLSSRELLYTEGGVLENFAPPAASLITSWQRRIVLAGLEDDTIIFSKEREDGAPVEFSEELRVTVDRLGGRIRAIAPLGDRLVIFKESAIYWIGGDGPNALGLGQFTIPKSVAADVGCTDSRSVVDYPEGLLFKSQKGIWRLRTDLGYDYVGEPVEDYNGETVTAAVVFETRNEIRWTTERLTLVYNYLENVWSVFPTMGANDAISWKDQFVYVKRYSDAPDLVLVETPGTFRDIDQTYPMRVGLGWISLAGLVGFQRVYRLLLLGEFKSKHKLRVQVGYDFSPAYTEEFYWDAQQELSISTYGDDAYYGSGSPYGGENNALLCRYHLEHQKCTSIRFLVEDTTQDEASFESFNLTGGALLVGAKPGAAKLRQEASR